MKKKYLMLVCLMILSLLIQGPAFRLALFVLYIIYLMISHYFQYKDNRSQLLWVNGGLLLVAGYCVFMTQVDIGAYAFAGLYLLLGYLSAHVSQNSLVGIRIPSTQMSSLNWQKTHQLMYRLSFPAAMLVLVLNHFLPVEWTLGISLGMWLVPCILYSIKLGNIG